MGVEIRITLARGAVSLEKYSDPRIQCLGLHNLT